MTSFIARESLTPYLVIVQSPDGLQREESWSGVPEDVDAKGPQTGSRGIDGALVHVVREGQAPRQRRVRSKLGTEQPRLGTSPLRQVPRSGQVHVIS